jgi:hypothetical protein
MENFSKITHRSHGGVILAKVREAQMQQNPRLGGTGSIKDFTGSNSAGPWEGLVGGTLA